MANIKSNISPQHIAHRTFTINTRSSGRKTSNVPLIDVVLQKRNAHLIKVSADLYVLKIT